MLSKKFPRHLRLTMTRDLPLETWSAFILRIILHSKYTDIDIFAIFIISY